MSSDQRVATASGMVVPALAGAAAAVLASPVAAALVAVVHRFPVPFAGYAQGFAGAPTAALGSLFYLLLGGVLVLAAAGAGAGVLAGRRAASRSGALTLSIVLGCLIALAGALSLALLEYVIGPW
ncbi:MAG: hypothetical protein ACRDT6_20745 [Micromonosporaceae bacterium]